MPSPIKIIKFTFYAILLWGGRLGQAASSQQRTEVVFSNASLINSNPSLPLLLENSPPVESPSFFSDVHEHDEYDEVEMRAEFLRLLSSIDMDLRKEEGFTPLHWCALKGEDSEISLGLASYFIRYDGADVDAQNIRGHTSLHFAASQNALAMIDLLLRAGGDPNLKEYEEGLAPLHITALYGDVSSPIAIAERLLKAGADINSQDFNGNTALIAAIENNKLALVKFFLKKDANVNLSDKNGRTPLHAAVQQRNKKIVQLLISYDADAHAADLTGETPCDLANEDKEYFFPDSKNGSDFQHLCLSKQKNSFIKTFVNIISLFTFIFFCISLLCRICGPRLRRFSEKMVLKEKNRKLVTSFVVELLDGFLSDRLTEGGEIFVFSFRGFSGCEREEVYRKLSKLHPEEIRIKKDSFFEALNICFKEIFGGNVEVTLAIKDDNRFTFNLVVTSFSNVKENEFESFFQGRNATRKRAFLRFKQQVLKNSLEYAEAVRQEKEDEARKIARTNFEAKISAKKTELSSLERELDLLTKSNFNEFELFESCARDVFNLIRTDERKLYQPEKRVLHAAQWMMEQVDADNRKKCFEEIRKSIDTLRKQLDPMVYCESMCATDKTDPFCDVVREIYVLREKIRKIQNPPKEMMDELNRRKRFLKEWAESEGARRAKEEKKREVESEEEEAEEETTESEKESETKEEKIEEESETEEDDDEEEEEDKIETEEKKAAEKVKVDTPFSLFSHSVYPEDGPPSVTSSSSTAASTSDFPPYKPF